MKKVTLLLFSFAIAFLMVIDGYSQSTLTILDAYEQAIERSPIQKQKLYLESIAELNTKSYQSINYPQLFINAQATYQSDVFKLPFQVPNTETPIVPNEQYKVAVDFYQNIYNGGMSKSSVAMEKAKMQSEMQSLEISFHQIREVINSLFFGILKSQEQINAIENVQKDLNNQKGILQAAVDEGAALPISVKILSKEIITLEQRLIELESSRMALIEMLGKWLEQPLDAETELELPEVEYNSEPLSINRPESRQFDLQSELIESRKSQLTASRIPNIGIFGTAGIGNPNPLNFFEVELSPYWLAGIKLSWKILDYGKASRDKEILGLQQQTLISAKENFEKSIEINLSKHTSDVLKYQQLLEKDRQIVELQNEIIAVSSSQHQNGVINSNDYLIEVNRGLNATINMRIHEIDLEQAKIELITLTGNSNKI